MASTTTSSLNQKIIKDPPQKIAKALFVGINYVGTRNELKGCVTDVNKKFEHALRFYNADKSNTVLLTDDPTHLSQEFQKRGIVSESPTKGNMIMAMEWLVSGVSPGDLVYMHYSGHGSQQRDTNGDEEDRQDECLCPVDMESAGMLVDDEIRKILDKVPEGVYFLGEEDCCHSSTIGDLRELAVISSSTTSNNGGGGGVPLTPPPVLPPKPGAIPLNIQYPPFNYHPQGGGGGGGGGGMMMGGGNAIKPMVVKIGGVSYYTYPVNPMYARREHRVYPCLVLSGNPESNRSRDFAPIWDSIVTNFCGNNNVQAYEEIAENRAPLVRFYYDPDTYLSFNIPEEFKVLDAFLVDRNTVKHTTEEQSRGLFSQFTSYIHSLQTTYLKNLSQFDEYVGYVHNIVGDWVHRTHREVELISRGARSARGDVVPQTKKYTLKTFNNAPPTRGVVVIWSGCQDNQTSADAHINNTPVGAMSNYHIAALLNPSNIRNIDVLYDERRELKRFNYEQIPQLSFGRNGVELMESPHPLHISRAEKK